MALRSVRTLKRAAGRDRGRTALGTVPKARDAAKPSPPGAVPKPVSGTWLVRGKDGRLTAYGQTANALVRWTENRAGSALWTGPERFPVPSRGTVLSLSAAQSSAGYVHLIAFRSRPAPNGGDKPIDYVHAIQFQTGRPLRDWQQRLTPYKDHSEGVRMGTPAVLVDTQHSVHWYVQNAAGRVAYRQQGPKGRFNRWERSDLLDTLVTGQVHATQRDDGVIEVLGPAADRIMYWQRENQNAPLVRMEDQEPAAEAAPGTLSSEQTGPGRVTFFWRDRTTSHVRAWRPGTDVRDLGGPGTGPVSVLRTPVDGVDCTILGGRGQDGRPVLAACPTEDEEAGLTWVSSGDPCRGTPALALDGTGRVVLAAIAEDGRLCLARQKAEAGLALEAWTAVTSG